MSNRPLFTKILLSVSAATVATAGFVVIPAVSASAASVTVTAAGGGVSVNKRAGATTSSAIVGRIPDRSGVIITCYQIGQTIQGGVFNVTSNIWDKTTDGAFVWDGALQTYSNGPVVPLCTYAPSPVQATSAKSDRAVAWANSMVGSQAYQNLCERFIEHSYGVSGRYGSAIQAFYSMRAAGQMHYNATGIPNGALAFSRGPLDGGYGHVMLSRGNGSFVSGGANGPSVKIFYTPNPGSSFLGWAYAPASWAGR